MKRDTAGSFPYAHCSVRGCGARAELLRGGEVRDGITYRFTRCRANRDHLTLVAFAVVSGDEALAESLDQHHTWVRLAQEAAA